MTLETFKGRNITKYRVFISLKLIQQAKRTKSIVRPMLESSFLKKEREGQISRTQSGKEFPSVVARGTFADSSSGEADGAGCLDKGRLNCTALAEGGENVSCSPFWPRFSRPAWGFGPLTCRSRDHFFNILATQHIFSDRGLNGARGVLFHTFICNNTND